MFGKRLRIFEIEIYLPECYTTHYKQMFYGRWYIVIICDI